MAGVMVAASGGCIGEERSAAVSAAERARRGVVKEEEEEEEEERRREQQVSLLALLLAAVRRSVVACRMERRGNGEDYGVLPTAAAVFGHMEIGWPTDVRHVAHVTFDRFHGFLGLPVEFEIEVPCRSPSASVSVFGVSAESMQCGYDTRGNSIPTILLLMQEKLYQQEGLKAEGIFRINPENSQEEHVRDQLNKGIVPDDMDVHCLAGLIKAWFRELPEGVLDGLSPEQVLNCNTEEECMDLVQQLRPTQAALLTWAVEIMADVVEEEDANKMNARNIAMVFAPNMTQMSDPLTALMHAVQVMNFLKTLILKTLRERDEGDTGDYSSFSSSPASSDQQGDDYVNTRHSSISRQSTSSDDQVAQSPLERDLEGGGCVKEVANSPDIVLSRKSNFEDEPIKEIESCFLRQLGWQGDTEDAIKPRSPLLADTDQSRLGPSDYYNVNSRFKASSKDESCLTMEVADWDKDSIKRNVCSHTKNLLDQQEGSKQVAVALKCTTQ